MPEIRQLSPHVADLIAAGEVVERPASVVKELVENALDAGASAVTVEIRNGGMSLIRVTDNGCGIAPEQLPTAFLRHATSKLRTEEDLAAIRTLGFRGEALAAIAAVSRVEIATCQAGAEGASLALEGGVPGEVSPEGVPQGTTIRVRDLFYNTPARLKFMKKDTAETAAVNGLLQHLALSRPDVSFRFIKDGTEALHTPGDGKLSSAVYAALGREFASSLLEISGSGGEIKVHGFVTKPLFGRGSRSMQIFFVNGRFIKSQLLTAALEESYRNQSMKGRFPGCVLFVTLPHTAVDVNVHPAKTQVKFARDKEVFDAVYHTVMDALDADGRPMPAAKPAAQQSNPRQDFYQTMTAEDYRRKNTASAESAAPKTAPARPAWNTEWKSPAARVADAEKAKQLYQAYAPAKGVPAERLKPVTVTAEDADDEIAAPASLSAPKTAPAVQVFAPEERAAEVPAEKADAAESKEVPAVPEKPARPFVPAIPEEQTALEMPEQETFLPRQETPWRIAGEILRTYIICEAEDGAVWLIDKHAAHERIHFDRLMAAREPVTAQRLLRPIPAELGKEDAALLLENAEVLAELGFACEGFGGDTVLIREVPADINADDAVATLEELAQKLRTGRDPAEKREHMFHTMACKAAIKAGMVSDPAELRVLADRVQAGEIKYCPHGRPVAVKLTKYELEKMFKRA